MKRTFTHEVKFARLRNRLVHAVIATVLFSPSWQVHFIEISNSQTVYKNVIPNLFFRAKCKKPKIVQKTQLTANHLTVEISLF